MYQEAVLAKQGTQIRAPMQKGSVQKVEAETGKKEEIRNIAWAWRDDAIVKIQLQMRPARDIKGNKNLYYPLVVRLNKESVSQLLNGTGD